MGTEAHADTSHNIPARKNCYYICFTDKNMGSEPDIRLSEFIFDSIAFWENCLLSLNLSFLMCKKGWFRNTDFERALMIRCGHAGNVPGNPDYLAIVDKNVCKCFPSIRHGSALHCCLQCSWGQAACTNSEYWVKKKS